MNASNFAHAGLSLLFQSVTTLIAYFCGLSIADASCLGGSVAIGFYIGREVTQAERKAGGNPWWVGFDVRRWTLDAKLDLLFPIVACLGLVALIAAFAQ